MKCIGFMNGWIDAPHCWRTYLLHPIRIERLPGWWLCVSVFGLVWFFDYPVSVLPKQKTHQD